MHFLKPNQKCASCKRVIDQEGSQSDRSLRLGLLEDGAAYCRRCANDYDAHLENVQRS
jgi:hypothetical protein